MGIKLIKMVIIAIAKFALISPKPYSINTNKLFLLSLATPKDQKQKIALSSQGIAVWSNPNKNAGRKMR